MAVRTHLVTQMSTCASSYLRNWFTFQTGLTELFDHSIKAVIIKKYSWMIKNGQNFLTYQCPVVFLSRKICQFMSVKVTCIFGGSWLSVSIFLTAKTVRTSWEKFFPCFVWVPKFDWLYVVVMSRTRFRVNPHSIVVWMSRNSLLEAGAKSEV